MSYNPQKDVAHTMGKYGQEVRTTPTMPSDPDDRLLRARLVFEEAMEFVEAMGCTVVCPTDSLLDPMKVVNTAAEPDLVAAADAVGDLLYVVYGSANTMGFSAEDVFNEVHRSNLTKVFPDGTVHRDNNGKGKVLKPEHYQPPNIPRVLGLEGGRNRRTRIRLGDIHRITHNTVDKHEE